MGESFQDYSWIQDFGADLKMLNYSDFNSFSNLFLDYLKTVDNQIFQFLKYFEDILQVLTMNF